ncbi:MAG: flagellar protein, partial [Bradyrhizobium sp.]|nr:flagellar protein [Bradyrhizobium sp.]
MSIVGVSGKTSYIGAQILSLRSQLDDLQTQLSTGKVSTTYAGQGPDRAFALGLRAQIANINAYADSANNVQTRINVANLSLQGLANVGSSVKSASTSSTIVLNNNGQTSGQITAQAAFANAISMLNTQSGDRYLFSGRATDTPATVPANDMLYGIGSQAGLTQMIDERRQADQGPGPAPMGRVAVTAPALTTTVTSVAEDGSAFGLKLSSVSSTLTGATIAQPAGAPPATTVDLGAVNPNSGEKVKFNFKLPDGTIESIELTALTTTTTPPAAGTFQIGVDTDATTVNLQAALTASIQKLADTSLVAASAIQASDNFFNSSATISGSAVNNKDTVPAAITGATLLSGAAPTDSLATDFAAG